MRGAFVKEGAAVVIADVRDETGGNGSAMPRRGGTCVFQHAEVSRSAEFKVLVERVVKEYGRLDILLNSAAVAGPYGPDRTGPRGRLGYVHRNKLKRVLGMK